VKDLLAQAKGLYREGKFAEAESLYLKALQLDPKNTEALKGLGVLALWNNRLQEAEEFFAQARKHSPLPQRIWPFNLSLQAASALVYYRANRLAEASRHFYAAAGLGLGPFASLKAHADHLAAFGTTTPYVIEGPQETRLPFVVTDPLPVVRVGVNDSEPEYFVIDTGAAELMLEPRFAQRVGARLSGRLGGTFAGGKQAAVGLGRVDSVSLGEFLIRNVPVNVLENRLTWEELHKLFGREIRGIVGTLLLYQFLPTLDYADGALILRRKTLENLRAFEQQAEARGAKAIPFWMTQTHFLVAWGRVNGHGPYLLSVDTGLAGKGFTAPESTLKEVGIVVDWTQAEEGFGGGGKTKTVEIVVEELALGIGEDQVVERDVLGSAIEGDEKNPNYQQGFRVGGIISHQFFRKYALTFDFLGMRLFLERKENEKGGNP